MWKNIWEWVFRRFGVYNSGMTEEQLNENAKNAMDYSYTGGINFNALFSKHLASLATSDSDFILACDNRRAELLNRIGLSVWKNINKITALSLGTGGCLLVPYVQKGELRFDIASQDRLCIHEKQGDKITAATVLADSIVLNRIRYYRFVNYKIEGGTLRITHMTTNEHGAPATVEQWKDLHDMAIRNVDRVPFGYLKSPVDNRRCTDDYGVPITYGCKKVIRDILECLQQYADEFKLKEVRLQLDERAFARDEAGKPILSSKLFMAGHNTGDENMFNIFDPPLRENSYCTRLNSLYELLEKSIGTSRGILTKAEATYENLEAIRAANRDTWALVSSIRAAIGSAYRDFLYACDVLANYYQLTPAGNYDFSFDWDYSVIERTADTWQQMKDGQAIGIRSKAELRAWQTGESIEEAQKAIDEITAREPSLNALLGMEEASAAPQKARKQN